MIVKPIVDVVRLPDAIRLDEFPLYLVAFVADQITKQTHAIAKSNGLNVSHWRVLAALADCPGRTAQEVVSITPMDKGIVSRAVKGLIGLGMVTRKASDEDGRIGHLFLTKDGELVYTKIANEVRRINSTMLQSLTEEEIAAFNETIGKLSHALKT